jgi:uncharacterized membrane protein YozB (DUF420 family)
MNTRSQGWRRRITSGHNRQKITTKSADLLDRYFYFIMSLVIAGVVIYGFSQTINENLIHPAYPRPLVLYFHAAIFGCWVVLLITQSALVRTRNVRLHRKLGLCALALAVVLPIVGIATGIAMGRFNTQHGSTDAAEFLIVPLFDMVAFAIVVGLAIVWRKKPEYHRRLMFLATCGLTVAAFNRFPASVVPDNWGYAGVDALILLGVGRDLFVTKRIHPVYLYGLPMMILGQALTMYIYLTRQPEWMVIAHRIIG